MRTSMSSPKFLFTACEAAQWSAEDFPQFSSSRGCGRASVSCILDVELCSWLWLWGQDVLLPLSTSSSLPFNRFLQLVRIFTIIFSFPYTHSSFSYFLFAWLLWHLSLDAVILPIFFKINSVPFEFHIVFSFTAQYYSCRNSYTCCIRSICSIQQTSMNYYPHFQMRKYPCVMPCSWRTDSYPGLGLLLKGTYVYKSIQVATILSTEV